MKSVLTWNEDEHSRKRNAKNVPDRNETPLTASAATSLKLHGFAEAPSSTSSLKFQDFAEAPSSEPTSAVRRWPSFIEL